LYFLKFIGFSFLGISVIHEALQPYGIFLL